MRRAVLLIPALLAAAMLASCSSETAGTPSPTDSSCIGPNCGKTIAALATPAKTPADRFVDDVLAYPGLSTDMTRQDLAALGAKICDAIGTPGVTRENLTTAMGTTKFGPQVAQVLVDTAARSYCPERSFSTAPAVQLPGNLGGNGFGAGTYEVGTALGQMAPGKYKSTGPEGSSMCYYARLKNNDGASGDIIDNDVSQGASILNVKASDGYVKISGCTFTKA